MKLSPEMSYIVRNISFDSNFPQVWDVKLVMMYAYKTLPSFQIRSYKFLSMQIQIIQIQLFKFNYSNSIIQIQKHYKFLSMDIMQVVTTRWCSVSYSWWQQDGAVFHILGDNKMVQCFIFLFQVFSTPPLKPLLPSTEIGVLTSGI